MKYYLIIFGTRPEFIKIMPLVFAYVKRNQQKNYKLLYTGQQDDLVKDLFELWDIHPDFVLGKAENAKALADSVSHMLLKLSEFISVKKKNIRGIIAQGDTTSCFCAAMVSFLNKIPFAHIEAGLRTFDLENPFPEEFFRRIISLAASVHFAPTVASVKNLEAEGINRGKIVITGNTIVDAIEIIKRKRRDYIKPTLSGIVTLNPNRQNVLITCHRRENQTTGFRNLVNALRILLVEYPDLNFIFLSHPNHNLKNRQSIENLCNVPNLQYLPFINIHYLYGIYEQIKIIITDSGGIQEESVSFGIPAVIIRQITEREESVNMGYAFLAGNTAKKICQNFNHAISLKLEKKPNPFGDGKAAERILDYLTMKNTL